MQPINNKAILLILIFNLALIAGFGIDIYAPSLPAMADYFHVPASATQLALGIYLLGYGIGQPLFGTLSDCYGRKIPLVTGVVLYGLASFAAALFANSITFVIVMRLLQGIGGSATGAVNKAIVMDSFPAAEVPKYATFMTICWSLGPIVAPIIGGYLQHYYGWQSNFLLQGIQCVIVLLFLLATYRESNQHPMKFNLTAIAKIYLKVISHKVFAGSLLLMALMYSMMIIFNIISPFLVQKQLHYSAIAYGHVALYIGLAYFIGTSLNRLLLERYSPDKLTDVSLYLSLLVSLIMVLMSYVLSTNIWLITVPSFLLFLLGGMIFPNCMAKGMALFKEHSGAAGAVAGCLFVVGSFLVSYMASLLNVHTILPMSNAYLILTISYLLVRFSLLR